MVTLLSWLVRARRKPVVRSTRVTSSSCAGTASIATAKSRKPVARSRSPSETTVLKVLSVGWLEMVFTALIKLVRVRVRDRSLRPMPASSYQINARMHTGYSQGNAYLQSPA